MKVVFVDMSFHKTYEASSFTAVINLIGFDFVVSTSRGRGGVDFVSLPPMCRRY